MTNGYRICRGNILFYLRDHLKHLDKYGEKKKKPSSDQDLKGQTLPNRHKKNGKRIGKGKTFPKEYQTIESKYVT